MSSHTPGSFSSSSSPARSTSGRLSSLHADQAPTDSTSVSSKLQDSPLSNGSVRRKVRHGGFLLGPFTRTSHSKSTSRQSGSSKGKEKESGRDGGGRNTTPHRRSIHEYGPSIGSSPLASHVSSVHGETDERAAGHAPGQETDRDKRAHALELNGARNSRQTDPAALVNLALQLSQSRSRIASGRFQPPLAGTASGGRAVSLGNPAVLAPGSPNLRYNATTAKRAVSNHIQPPQTATGIDGVTAPAISNGLDTQQVDTVGPGLATDLDAPGVAQFLPSPQTIIRAERARVAIELKYQHRRLLQYLPKYPVPIQTRPRAGTIESRRSRVSTDIQVPNPSDTLGQQYNPLQYARNRRLRYREQRTINAEEQGWKDIDRVVDWVDDVSKAKSGDQVRPKNLFALPRFSTAHESTILNSGRLSIGDDKPNKPKTRLPLPPNDWTTNPWDLLADSYWVQQDDNRRRIEDRNGDKIFPLHATVNEASSKHRSKDDAHRQSQRFSQAEIPGLPRSTGTKSETGSDESDLDIAHNGEDAATEALEPSPSKPSRVKRFSKRFSRTQPVSNSSDDLSDDEKKKRRPWSATFGQRWQGASMPDKKPPSQPDSHQEETNGVRSSLEVPSPYRASKDGKRPFSIDLKPIPQNGIEETKGSHGHRRFRSITSTVSGFDSTAPSSPAYSGVFPSYPTDLDPRSNSRSSDRDSKTGYGLGDRLDETQHKDFAEDPFKSDLPEWKRIEKWRTHTSTLSSPSETSFSAASDRSRPPGSSRDIDKPSASPETELGFHPLKPWKGGAIVGRARDLLRRKEYGSDTSDTDEEGRRRAVRASLSRTVTSSSIRNTIGTDGPLETVGESPHYRGLELPTFRSTRQNSSPSSKDRKKTLLSAWQAPSSTNSGKGSDRVPTPVDVNKPTIAVSAATSHRQSEEQSGESSASRSRNASRRRGTNERRGATFTDTSGTQWPLKSRTDAIPWPGEENEGRTPHALWTGPELRPTREGNVTSKDIARVRMILLSAIYKGNWISQYYESVPTKQTANLHEIRQYKADQAPVSRMEEPMILARCLEAAIDTRSNALDAALRRLTTETQPALATRYDKARAHIDDVLMEKALTAGEEADKLGANIASDYTLEVKRLNDRIDMIWRQRRRRSRWLRRIVFALLEWTLLGIMWGLWFVVVCFKMVRGSVRGTFAVIRWLLWL